MKDKLEVGMYARTENGIKEIEYYKYYDEYENGHQIDFKGNSYGLMFTEEELPKCSWNLIDLIEVGDYVNGHRVACVMKSLLGFEDGQDGDWYMENKDIKSIVTKEQFDRMAYRIEA